MKNKRFIAIIVVIFALTIGIACSPATTTPAVTAASEISTLAVSGSGSVAIKPDNAIISIGVQTNNIDIEAAQNENNIKIQSVMDTLINNGVEKDNISTSNYSVYPVYDYNGQQRTLTSYEIRNTLNVKIEEIDKTGQILSAVVASGVNDINSINFTSSNSDDAYLEALDLAYKDAEKKALSMAESAGLKLGEIKFISEGSSYSVDNLTRGMADLNYAKESSVPIETGTLQVNANVSVSYCLK